MTYFDGAFPLYGWRINADAAITVRNLFPPMVLGKVN